MTKFLFLFQRITTKPLPLTCEIVRNITWYLAGEAVRRVGENQEVFRKIEKDDRSII